MLVSACHGPVKVLAKEERRECVQDVCFRNVYTKRTGNVMDPAAPRGHVPVSGGFFNLTEIADDRGKSLAELDGIGSLVLASPRTAWSCEFPEKTFSRVALDGSKKRAPSPYRHVIATGHGTTVGIREGSRARVWDALASDREGGKTKPSSGSAWSSTQEEEVRQKQLPLDFDVLDDKAEVLQRHQGVRELVSYGDYVVLVHQDGASATVLDASFNPVTPRIPRTYAMQQDRSGISVVVVTEVARTDSEERRLFRPLPSSRGATWREDVLGLIPIYGASMSGSICPNGVKASTGACPVKTSIGLNELHGWFALWATPEGPAFSYVSPKAEVVPPPAYRKVARLPTLFMFMGNARESHRFAFERLDGSWGSAKLVVSDKKGRRVGAASFIDPSTRIDLAEDTTRATSEAQALAGARALDLDEERRDEARAREQLRRAQEYAAWLHEKSEEQARARRAEEAGAARELAEANALDGGRSDLACAAARRMKSYYAKNLALETCHRAISKAMAAEHPKDDFGWGRIAPVVPSYGAAAAPATPSSGSYDSYRFNQSMRTIDTTLRVLSDPNYNGAFSASQR